MHRWRLLVPLGAAIAAVLAIGTLVAASREPSRAGAPGPLAEAGVATHAHAVDPCANDDGVDEDAIGDDGIMGRPSRCWELANPDRVPTPVPTLEDPMAECIRKLQASGAEEGYCGGRRTPDAERVGNPSRLRTATPFPTPITARALDKAAGEQLLARIPGVSDVLTAVKTSDVVTLLALTERTIRSCPDRARSVTYSKRQCEEFNGAVDGRYEGVLFGEDYHLSMRYVRPALEIALAARPIELTFAARDTRPEHSTTYYLYFKTARYSINSTGANIGTDDRNGIALIVTSGLTAPVRSILLAPESAGPLRWVQDLHEPQFLELILPATLDGFERR